jgi:HAMP domain-containing protein
VSTSALPQYPALRRTARAVAESLFSAPGSEAPADRLDWVAAEVEDIAVHAGPRGLLVMRVVAALLSVLAPLWVRRFGTVAALALPARTVALQRMEDSFAAPLVLALKAILCTVWYEHPDVAREVGWTGHSTGRIDRVLAQ